MRCRACRTSAPRCPFQPRTLTLSRPLWASVLWLWCLLPSALGVCAEIFTGQRNAHWHICLGIWSTNMCICRVSQPRWTALRKTIRTDHMQDSFSVIPPRNVTINNHFLKTDVGLVVTGNPEIISSIREQYSFYMQISCTFYVRDTAIGRLWYNI